MPRVVHALVSTAIVLAVSSTVAWAQPPKAGVVTTLEGNVTATHASAPQQPVPLKFKDDVLLQDRITTGSESLARMLLGGKAVVTVREHSVITITQVPGRSIIDIESGKFALAVARERMQTGEVIDIRTPNAVAGVRGSVVVTEVQNLAGQPTTSDIYLLQGQPDSLAAQPADPVTRAPIGTPRPLKVLEQFRVVGLIGTVNPIRLDQLPGIRAGLQPRSRPHVQSAGSAPLIATAVALAATVSASSDQTLSFPTPAPTNTIAPITPIDHGKGSSPAVSAQVSSPATATSFIQNFGSAIPASLSGCDDCGLPVSFGFSFPFRGQSYTSGNLSSNGFLLLGGNSGVTSFVPNVPEFLSGLPRIAVGWADWDLRVGNGIKQNVIPGGIVYTFDSVGEFPVIPTNATFQLQLLSNGQIVFSYQSLNLTSSGHNVLVGVTPGGGAADPGQTRFLTAVPVSTPNGTVYQLFIPGASFNLNGHALIFTPNASGGWDVSDPDVPMLLDDAALTQFGPLYDFKAQSLTLDYPMLVLGKGMQDTLNDSLLRDLDSTLTLRSGLLRISGGGQLTLASSKPLVTLGGGTYTIGDVVAPAALLDVAGVTGGDKPIQGANGSAVAATLLETNNGATINVPGDGGRILRLDTALLEATAPLLNLQGGSTITVGGHVVDLASNARLTQLAPGDAFIKLDASTLNVLNGNVVNVAGGSQLSVAGDLLRLANGSRVNVSNGVLLSLSGGSVASIGGGLLGFVGSNNVVSVSNTFAPTAFVSGIPIFVGSGGTLGNLSLGSATLAGVNTSGNTVRINGAALPTGATSASGITGSLIAIQGLSR